MTPVQLRLKPSLQQRVSQRAAESGFDTIEGYIESLLKSDAGEGQLVPDQELEQLLLHRLDSGPGIELNGEFKRRFKSQIAARRRARKARP